MTTARYVLRLVQLCGHILQLSKRQSAICQESWVCGASDMLLAFMHFATYCLFPCLKLLYGLQRWLCCVATPRSTLQDMPGTCVEGTQERHAGSCVCTGFESATLYDNLTTSACSLKPSTSSSSVLPDDEILMHTGPEGVGASDTPMAEQHH